MHIFFDSGCHLLNIFRQAPRRTNISDLSTAKSDPDPTISFGRIPLPAIWDVDFFKVEVWSRILQIVL